MIDFPQPLRINLVLITLASIIGIGAAPVATNFDQRVLLAHNAERARFGLGPLRWNPALAGSAETWAAQLAATRRFEHARDDPVAPQGENLWEGTRGYFPPEAMVNAWVREKKYFKPGIFPDNSVTGNVEDVGHYTQLMWRATTEVGCATAANAQDDVLVCRYSQAGNYIGQRPF